MSERWKPVPGFAGAYEASDQGRVRSYRNGKWGLRQTPALMSGNLWRDDQYRRFILSGKAADGSPMRRAFRAHELVLLAFVGPRPGGLVTRHLNGNPMDNRLVNLTYGTYSENGLDAVRHGDNPRANKTECARGHTYTAETLEWDAKRRRRLCLECRVINNRNSAARRARTQRSKEQAA